MYLSLELIFSEPDQVATSTTDQPLLPLPHINTLETPQKPQCMPGAFGSPTLMKPLSALPLLVPSAPIPTISLPSGSSINPADYETFDNSEELSESERVVSHQPSSSRPVTPPPRNNQPPPTAPCTKHRASPPTHSDLEIEHFNHK